jgi:hypothetical protein
MNKMLCPPAHATSRARFADICPCTSRISTRYSDASDSISRASTLTGVNDSGEFTRSTACGSDFTANTSTPSTTAASLAFDSGTAIDLMPTSRAASVADSAPFTARTVPSSDSSPKNMHLSSGLPKKCPMQPASPIAIGKSNAEPSFLTSAGARLIVTPCPCGNSKEQFRSADLIRSRLSFTALSGSPTTLKSVIFADPTSTSTSTR